MELFLHQLCKIADQYPDRIAVTFNGQSYRYAAMKEATMRLRGSLAARGIRKGDPVAILLPNSPHFVIAHMAVIGLGAVSVPINIYHKAQEINFQLEDVEAKALISWTNFTPETEKAISNLESINLRIYLGDELPPESESLLELMTKGELLPFDNSINENDTACLIYTPGVNGHPRGVELTHKNFAHQAIETGKLLRIKETDRFLGVLPFSTIMGLTMNVHLPLAFGAEVLPMSRFHPGDTLKNLQNEQITVFAGNPSMYASAANFPSSDKYDLSKLRYSISCEAKLTDETARDAEEKLHLSIYEGYGTTESCGIVSLNLFPGLTSRGSVGQAIPGQVIDIVDDQGNPLDAKRSGHVATRGPMVMKGYRNRPDKTRQTIREGWLITGDLGYMDEQSNLYVTGHTNEVIYKGGFPVYPREVEQIIEGLPHVREVAIIGIPDTVFGEELKACIVLKDGANIGPAEIIEYVKDRIAVYKVPKLIKFYKELPRTPSGKIVRTQLREDRTL